MLGEIGPSYSRIVGRCLVDNEHAKARPLPLANEAQGILDGKPSNIPSPLLQRKFGGLHRTRFKTGDGQILRRNLQPFDIL
jgi:hypothetical protein